MKLKLKVCRSGYSYFHNRYCIWGAYVIPGLGWYGPEYLIGWWQ